MSERFSKYLGIGALVVFWAVIGTMIVLMLVYGVPLNDHPEPR